jgi:two-component sensor histidine kinase
MNPINEFLDVASAVEQRVIAMEMQVNELVLSHEDSTWQLALSSRKTRADFILTSGGIRAMTESGATFSR